MKLKSVKLNQNSIFDKVWKQIGADIWSQATEHVWFESRHHFRNHIWEQVHET